MSTRSAVAGAAATVVLVGVLGSPVAQDVASDGDAPPPTWTVTVLPTWEVPDGAPARLVWGIVLRLAVLLVVAMGLCVVAGRSRSRGAAFRPAGAPWWWPPGWRARWASSTASPW